MSIFTDLVGCAVPVQQAPMGNVSTAPLAVAVAQAGALGTLGALASPEDLHAACDAVEGARGTLAFNVLVPAMNPETLDIAAERCRVVDFFWGPIDAALVARAKRHGALASWQVGSVQNARLAIDAGCDILIAQGREAGGHHDGATPLRELLPALLDGFDVPILAAGGIATGEDARALVDAGAAGVRVGTRFIATDEANAHPEYQRAIVEAGEDDFVETGAFSVGCPLCPSTHGVLRGCVEAAARAPDVVATIATKGGEFPVPRYSGLPPGCRAHGDIRAMALYAGAGVGRVRAVVPAAAVVEEFARAL